MALMSTFDNHKPQAGLATRLNLWFILLLAAVLVFGGLAVFRGTMQVIAAQKELKGIQKVNSRLKGQNQLLFQQVLRLKNDKRAQEKTCRQDLDLVRPGEVVYLEPGAAAKPLGQALAVGDAP
jgi:cell division protein FtsB